MGSEEETKRDTHTIDGGEGIEDDDAPSLLQCEQDSPPHQPATCPLLQHTLLPLFLLLLFGLSCRRHHPTSVGTTSIMLRERLTAVAPPGCSRDAQDTGVRKDAMINTTLCT
jgi:hypothetical protein